jgi:hypothetical protein
MKGSAVNQVASQLLDFSAPQLTFRLSSLL